MLEKYLNRKIYIDILKVFAIIAVIIIHISASTTLLTAFNSKYSWWVTNTFNSINRWAVPIFVMCSGVLVLNKKEDIKTFLCKRFSKILIPFILWSVYYYLYQINFNAKLINLSDFFKQFLQTGTYYHLWFVYMLIGLYLMTPIFRIIAQRATQKELRYMLTLWFVVMGAFPFINKIFNISLNLNIQIGWYAGFYFLGYYLDKYNIEKAYRIMMYFWGAISNLIILLGTYILTSKSNGNADLFFYGDNTILVILPAIALFLIIKNVKWVDIFTKVKVLPYIVYNIASCTYGIYLSHFFIKNFLYQHLKFDENFTNIIIGIPVLCIVILTASFAITKGYDLFKNLLLKYISKLKLKSKSNKPVEALH